ncbi:MAG TPA: hypothetical protein VNO31_02375, partial [Umezawaea sp.]|nr:hypothetical protein [Umezawaea sp.]
SRASGLLLAMRIVQGLSERDLATLLGVREAVVSTDERSEYYGIGVERAHASSMQNALSMCVRDRT